MTKKLKVLQVYRTYFPDTQGGAEEVVRQIGLATQSHNIETRIFVPSPSPSNKPLVIDGTKVIQVKLNFEVASCGFCFTGLVEFRRQLAWADVIHFHFPWPFADLMNFLISNDTPRVVTYHSDIVRQASVMKLYSPLMHRFLASVDAIVSTSPNYLETSQVLNQYRDKVEVIPIGIDEVSYPSVSNECISRMKHQFGDQFFLFVGMLRYYKGLDVLLKAIKNAPFRVVIAGSGPEELALHKLSTSLGLDNVVFAGRVSDEEKMALIELSKAVVLPSQVRSEAFGVTLLEGAMKSKPLVSIEIGTGTTYVNLDKETGIVAPPNDPVALREALDTLWFQDQLAVEMGQRSRKRYDDLFTAADMGCRYSELYRRLARNHV